MKEGFRDSEALHHISGNSFENAFDQPFGFGEVKDDYSLFCTVESAKKICNKNTNNSERSSSSACISVCKSTTAKTSVGAGASSVSGGHVKVLPNRLSGLKLNDYSSVSKGKALIGIDGPSFSAPLSRPQPDSHVLLKRTFGDNSDGDGICDLEHHHDSDCSAGTICSTWIRMMTSQAEKLSNQQNSIDIRPEGIMPANMRMINQQQQGQENNILKTQGGEGYNFQPIRSNAPESNMYSYERYMHAQQQLQLFGTNFQTTANFNNTNNYYQQLLGAGTHHQTPENFNNNDSYYPHQLAPAPHYETPANFGNTNHYRLLVPVKGRSAEDMSKNLAMIQDQNIEIIDVEEYESKKLVDAVVAPPQAAGHIVDVEENQNEKLFDHATDEEKKLENTGIVSMEIVDSDGSVFQPEATSPMDSPAVNGLEVGNKASRK